MSEPNDEREQQRRALLLRIEQDRAAIGRTLVTLRRPMQVVDRWQRGLRALLPMLPGLLLALAAAVLLRIALRGRESRGLTVAARAPAARNWLGLLQQVLIAWRLGMQLQAMLDAGPAGRADHRGQGHGDASRRAS